MTTGFLIESQRNLKEDPTNTSVLFLGKILQQLNQSIELPTDIEPFTSATTTDKLVNAFWFTSLSLSLVTVTIGLLCLQWIQEYKKDGDHLPHEQYYDFRYVKDEGFKFWKARGIIASLPLFLILSLLTFFGGLLVFLGTTDWIVAIPAYIILLFTVLLVIATAILPGILHFHKVRSQEYDIPSPPFRSLQSWIFLKIAQSFVVPLYGRSSYTEATFHRKDWVRLDAAWANWATNLCLMSAQPLLNLFSDSTERNTAVICSTLDELTSITCRLGTKENIAQETKDRYQERAHLLQLQAFALAVNLSILHSKSAQYTDASRLAWTDHLVERYTATIESQALHRAEMEKEAEFSRKVRGGIEIFRDALFDTPVGQGNLGKPHAYM